MAMHGAACCKRTECMHFVAWRTTHVCVGHVFYRAALQIKITISRIAIIRPLPTVTINVDVVT